MHNPSYLEFLDFLTSDGSVLSAQHPRVAGMLGQAPTDPDTEQLLAGICFIAGKVGEKQTASVDEYCQLLFDVLFPHYLAQIPGATTLRFHLLPDERPRTIPRGTEVHSVAVAGTPCRFRTIYDVDLSDLQLEELQWEPVGSTTLLTLRFSGPQWTKAEPELDRLRFHLHGEPLLSRSMYEWLARRLERIDLIDPVGRAIAIPELEIHHVGYRDEEALLPYPVGAFPGFRLVQEYLSFPQKFLFVDIPGVWEHLQKLGSADAGRFSLRLTLRADAEGLVVTKHNLQLHCTPAANWFPHTADPIRRTPQKMDYRVRPAGAHSHLEIVRVTGVSSFSERGSQPYPLVSELDLHSSEGTFSRLQRKLINDVVETYVSIFDGPTQLPREETVLVDLICSNGKLLQGLGVGDINLLNPDETGLRVENITPPSQRIPLPLNCDLARRLIRHLALSRHDLTELQSLRDTLDLYDFAAMLDNQAARAHQQLLSALLAARTEATQTRHRGGALWGHRTHLTVDEKAFPVPSEAYLFGCVLNEFIALQSPLNTFSEFGLQRAQTEDIHRWPKRLGARLLRSC